MISGYLLARAGIDVIVLEKHADFFRDFRADEAPGSGEARFRRWPRLHRRRSERGAGAEQRNKSSRNSRQHQCAAHANGSSCTRLRGVTGFCGGGDDLLQAARTNGSSNSMRTDVRGMASSDEQLHQYTRSGNRRVRLEIRFQQVVGNLHVEFTAGKAGNSVNGEVHRRVVVGE